MPNQDLNLDVKPQIHLRIQHFKLTSGKRELGGPALRDTARLSQRYPPIARYGGFRCLNMAN